MADGGELAAAFRALAEDAAQAGEDIGNSMGRWFEDTAGIEEENVNRTLAADAENARALSAIRGNSGNLSNLEDGTGDVGDVAGSAGGNKISRLLSGDDSVAPGVGDTEPGAGSGLGDAASNPSAAARGRGDMQTVGDPVDVATGDVVFAQADVTLPGVLPLTLERAHRSSHRTGRWFGRSWLSTFDQRLEVHGNRVIGAFADGRVLTWPHPAAAQNADAAGAASADGVLPEAGPCWTLRGDDGGAYAVTDPQRGLTWRFARRHGHWSYGLNGSLGELPLVSVSDQAGHWIVFEYGNQGQPTAVTHSSGYRVEVTTDENRIIGLTLAGADDGHAVPLAHYEYDGEDQHLSGVVNSSGLPLRFSYDPAGRLAGWTDRGGHSYQYFYDDHGRCVRGKSPSGAQSGIFDYEMGLTRWTDGEGAVWAYEVAGSARVTAITDPAGGVTRFSHDARDRVTAQTDPLGRVTQYAYDAVGNLIAVTRPDGSVARAEYDDKNLPVSVAGPDGTVWRQAYDALGNRTELTAPDGTVTRYSYDPAGHLASMTGPDGATTQVNCDDAGLPVLVSGPGGRATRYERDQFGRISRITGPDGELTTLTWTVEGRIVSRTLPDGTSETWTWDADGHLIQHASPSGTATSYEYGPFDKVTAAIWPDGTRAEVSYDHQLRLTSVSQGGLTWNYSYDAAGRLETETDYNGSVTRYWHDAAGQLIRRLNAVGQETTFAYDALGNLVAQNADGTDTTFAYDAAGRLVQARNPSAAITLERDAIGRVIAETCDGRTVTTAYDAAGRVTGRITPSGASTTWDYDPAGWPARMNADGRELRFDYGPSGLENRRELPGGVTLTQEWDARGRLSSQILSGPGPEGPAAQAQLLQRRSYAYHPDGFVAGTEDLLTGNRTFGLDQAGRVTTIAGPEWAEQYAYDPLGNVTSATWPTAPPELAGRPLDTGTQGSREVTGTLTRAAGNVRYRHDTAGRVIAKTRTRISRKPETWRYEWDADNRLVAATTADGTTWRYSYDPLGRRISKQHVTADGQILDATRFVWDGPILAEQSELTTAGEQVTTWDYRPGTFTPLTQASHTALRDAPQDEIDRRFYSIVTDLTGTPTELVSEDGNLAGHQHHTLWGCTIWHPSGASTPLRFPGQYDDPGTGLYYNNQRYYDPATGSYLSPDPLGLAPSPNPHAYVPNPHVLVDPLGLEPGTATRSAPDFIGEPSGKVQDVRNIGRPDNQLVLSGHGGIRDGDGTSLTVPPGTSIAMYSYHGEPISDYLGNQIETGSPTPVEVYHPGEKLPDYTLYPPDGLKILGMLRNVTVTGPTRLSELLQPNMGSVHWAACRSVIKSR